MVQCASCSGSLPDGAAFCGQCGARISVASPAPAPVAAPGAGAAGGYVQPGKGLAICTGCGAVAPSNRNHCELCTIALPNPRVAVPRRPDGVAFVQVRCERRCRSCGAWTPVNHLDLDETFRCARCDLVQAFDADAWKDALAHAHNVADLAGDAIPGNPLADIGTSKVSATLELSGMTMSEGVIRARSLRMQVAPGHPLCPSCRRPLEVRVAARRLLAACRSCGTEASHEVPTSAYRHARGLVGALADDHRTDQPSAEVVAPHTGGAVALRCPSCSAALEPSPASHFVRCGYCSVTSRVPSRTLFQVFHERAAADPWWLLFRGKSAQRSQLESRARSAASAREKAQVERGRGRIRAAPARVKVSGLDRFLGTAIPLGVLAAVGLLGFGDQIRGWRSTIGGSGATSGEAATGRARDASEDSRPGDRATARAAARAGSRRPAREEFIDLQGCECRARAGSSAEPGLVRLAVRFAGETEEAAGDVTQTFVDLDFLLDAGDGAPWILPLEAPVAPPPRIGGRRFQIGMACDGTRVVVVAGGHATAWSLEARDRLWTEAIEGWQPRPHGARSGVKINCRNLKIRGDVVHIPGGAGKGTARLGIVDGRRR